MFVSYNRNAKFVTVLCVVKPEEKPIFIRGEVAGYILNSITGNGGFGYDPVFQPENETRTFAEMSLAEKNLIAHRARALEKFKNFLDEIQKCADE